MDKQHPGWRAVWGQIIGARSDQQDACGATAAEDYAARGLLAVLSDGMGGMSAGELYSRVATETMLRGFAAETPAPDLCAQLLGLFLAAQREALRQIPGENEGGATVVAVLIRDGRCAFLSCGDSRIYLLRGGGLLQLNREHTLGPALDERAALGYLPQEDALYNTRRAALTSHLGMTPLKAVDRNLRPFDLLRGDRLALMSDGVFGTLDDDTLCRALKAPLDQAPNQVTALLRAAAHPKQDNASVLLVGSDAINTRM
ncbi:MAG: SpoIIE family protein phosphatase [Clostridiales bacterium]|nr:SpoIIE family protein phosphatase [Clostridiales bacterium]